MNNKVVAVIAVVVVLLGIAYVGRHQLKQMYSGQNAMPNAPTESVASNSTAITGGTSQPYQMKTSTKLGQYLADDKGMTLYTWDNDKPGVSNCTGQCLVNWPAYTTSAVPANLPANFGTMKRADGTIQYTWKEMPLYYFVGDKAPGDTTGDGVGGVWHVAK